MRASITLGTACLALLFLSGCAGTFVVYDPLPRPPVVVVDTDPGVVVVDPNPVVIVDMDYWYDGATYYYWDSGVSLYFSWNRGSRVYCPPVWRPQPHWHRHDRRWHSYDHGWRYPGHRNDGWWRHHNNHRGPVYTPPHRGPVYTPPHRVPPRQWQGQPPRGQDWRNNDHRWNNNGRGNQHDRGGQHHDRGGHRDRR